MGSEQDQRAERRARLGEHIRAACERRWGHEAEAVRNLPFARETLRRVWAGAPSSPKTYLAVEKQFGWGLGSIRRYLEQGGELPGAGDEDTAVEAIVIDRSQITRQEVITLLWSVTHAGTGIERMRELRKIEDEVMNDLK